MATVAGVDLVACFLHGDIERPVSARFPGKLVMDGQAFVALLAVGDEILRPAFIRHLKRPDLCLGSVGAVRIGRESGSFCGSSCIHLHTVSVKKGIR